MAQPQEQTRRGVLIGAAALGAGAMLVGCGRNEAPAAEPPDQVSDGGRTWPANTPLSAGSVKSSAVPVGGGTVIGNVVVTQPQPGAFVAFSAICTHRGCHVSGVDGGTINCPCHGAEFSISDGSVVRGPAAFPLSQVPVNANGDTLTFG